MKKVVIKLLVMVFMLGFVSQVYGETKLSISGFYAVRGWTEMNPSFDSDADNDRHYIDQEFDLFTKFKINDNMEANLTTHLAVGAWGRDFDDWGGWAQTKEDAELTIEDLYVLIDQEKYKVTVGSHYTGAGNYILWDQLATGITLNIKTPLAIMLNYSKMSEGYTEDEWGDVLTDKGTTEDVDFYGANISYYSDALSAGLTFATRQDNSDADISPWGVGIDAAGSIGPVYLIAEINQLGGSFGEDYDIIGTQALLDGSAAINDKVKVGLRFLYAMGTEEDDEIQATGVNTGAWSFNPFGFGDYASWAGELLCEYYPSGYSDSYLWGGGRSVWDPAGANAGVIAFSPYLIYNITDRVIAFANMSYQTPSEDKNTDLENLLTATISADMKVVDNLFLSAGYSFFQHYTDGNGYEDPRNTLVAQLKMKF